MRRLVSILVLGVFIFSLAAGSASANTTKVTYAFDDFYSSNHDCGFRVRLHSYGPYRIADQYDNDGNLFRTIITVSGGRYYITATANGVTLKTTASYQIVQTYNPDGSFDVYHEDGLHFGFTLPGGGVVLLETGRLVFDQETEQIIFEGGPHMNSDGDLEAFCQAFA